jgi:N-acetylated-alpha-linked acidic dipeptidase
VTAWKQVLADLHTTTEPHHHYMPFQNGPLGDIRDTNTGRLLNPETNNVNILGSGSDYTVFLDHFGISSLDFSFGKSTTYGQYHSIYDSFAWMDAYGGIEGKAGSAFDLMAFAAKIWGVLALRLADSAVLPFDHSVQGNALSDYVTAIENQHTGLDLTILKDVIQQFQDAAAALQAACDSKDNRHTLLDEQACNEKLGLTERQFLSEEGLPDRPWFKHILQAPGMYLGYAAEAFPGIQQSIDADDLDLAQKQVVVATERVQAAASFMQTNTDEEMSSHL